MSATRQQRIARQLERVKKVFDDGSLVSRRMLALKAEIPESSIGGLMCRLRHDALDNDHLPVVEQIGGQWIYGWEITWDQWLAEEHKRLKLKRGHLRLTKTMQEQALSEHDDPGLRGRLRDTRQELETCEDSIGELASLLRKVRRQVA